MLFRSVNETLVGFAKHPKWKLEGQPSFIAVMHTWNQELRDHFHLHVILPAGVLRGTDFIRSPQERFLFPVRALGNVFAAKYRDDLLRAFERGKTVAGRRSIPYKPAAQLRKKPGCPPQPSLLRKER
jgi:hypothetical protein